MSKENVMYFQMDWMCFVLFPFKIYMYSLFFMDTSEVPAPGGFALVSHATAFDYLAVT